MKRFWIVAAAVATFVLVSFLLVEALGISLLVDPSNRIQDGGMGAALLGGGLLLADVLLPIPSSVIMIAHGAAFGIPRGTLLSLTTSVGGAMIGWYIGHRGRGLLGRLIPPAEQENAALLIRRWGMTAIVISRFLPVVAETVAVMSGTTNLGWKRVLLVMTIGTLPPALIYAIAGTLATVLASGVLVAVSVMFLAAVAWFLGRRLTAPASPAREPTPGQP